METLRNNRQRGWISIAAGGVLALGLVGFGVSRLIANQQQARQAAIEAQAPAPERVEVVALGRLEPQGEVVRVGGPTGERLARLLVQQGDQVKAGTVLAYLESYEEQLAQRDLAASQLREAEQRLQAQTSVGNAQIQEAQTRIQQVDRPTNFQIQAQEASIRDLEAQLALAQTNLRRSQDLLSQGAISQQSLDQQVTQTRQIQEQLNSARANLVRLQTQRQADLQNAQAQVRSQQANATLSQVQAAVESARQNLNLAQAKLDRTIIRAPQDGRILRVITHSGETIAEDGILDLGNTNQMAVVAEVYESDIGLVQVGQTATITSRNGAFETPITGKVSEIGWQIFKNNVLDDDPAANADARVVEVRVRLDDSKPVEALTNLQVDIRIDVK
ncbi:HlyD family efflux transporter periplasmic adaptor subunit [Leptolyngbya ohadii]|uniref:HlyD family efflux transporter periplasmic adaptor subunit n=1 Tax=Leptolyngbya ohadii TaxID=1962290 RepID=UPI000B5A1313|nr:HlyD family efflux transporter periplasmic adaptor subunit [Leptolyngbya ohadii]